MTLSHFDAEGRAHMVNVSDKPSTDRMAIAEAMVRMTAETLAYVTEGRANKGDVLGVARLAGIMAAKRTADLIPLCHPLPLTHAAVDPVADPTLPGVRIRATVRTSGVTGVEMEALTAAFVAALTVYDMLKAVEKTMVIDAVRLVLKDGGTSGRFVAQELAAEGNA
jgi:cyclic pyranopterin monophosphate synthase